MNTLPKFPVNEQWICRELSYMTDGVGIRPSYFPSEVLDIWDPVHDETNPSQLAINFAANRHDYKHLPELKR